MLHEQGVISLDALKLILSALEEIRGGWRRGELEVKGYLKMANVMAVDRLKYNDHGQLHSRISAGSALEFFNILSRRVEPTTVDG